MSTLLVVDLLLEVIVEAGGGALAVVVVSVKGLLQLQLALHPLLGWRGGKYKGVMMY